MRKILTVMLAVIMAASLATVETAGAENKVGDAGTCNDIWNSASPPPSRSTAEVCNADNGGHWYHYDHVGPRTQAAIYSTMSGSWGTISNLDDYITSQPHNTTDVYFDFQNLDHLDYSDTKWVVGLYWCLVTYSATECDHAHVAFDPATHGGIANFSDSQLKGLACHETGHSLGQLHPPGGSTDTNKWGCMTQGTHYPLVRSHNVADIESNGHY